MKHIWIIILLLAACTQSGYDDTVLKNTVDNLNKEITYLKSEVETLKMIKPDTVIVEKRTEIVNYDTVVMHYDTLFHEYRFWYYDTIMVPKIIKLTDNSVYYVPVWDVDKKELIYYPIIEE